MRRFSTLLVVGVVLGMLLATQVVYGDTVHLDNGRSLQAEKATEKEIEGDPRTKLIPEGMTRLLYSNGGWQDVRTSRVLYIVRDSKDAFKR